MTIHVSDKDENVVSRMISWSLKAFRHAVTDNFAG